MTHPEVRRALETKVGELDAMIRDVRRAVFALEPGGAGPADGPA